MKKTLLAGIAVLLMATSAARATEDFCGVLLKPPANVVSDKEYDPDGWLALREAIPWFGDCMKQAIGRPPMPHTTAAPPRTPTTTTDAQLLATNGPPARPSL